MRGDRFELEITSRFGTWDVTDGEYLFTDCNRFTRGVGELKFTAEVMTEPETVAGYRAESNAEMVHHRDPTMLDFDIEEIELGRDSSSLEYWIQDEEVFKSVYVLELQW
jgi:hypothetical protein